MADHGGATGTAAAQPGRVQVGASTGDGQEPGMVSLPVFFGTAIAPGFRSYFLYTVQPGDTLSGIAAAQAPLVHR